MIKPRQSRSIVCLLLLLLLPAVVADEQPLEKLPLQALIKQAKTGDGRARALAATELGRRKARRQRPLLAKMLQRDPSTDVRAAAAEAIGKLGARGALRGLIALIRTEQDGRVRRSLARASAWIDPRAAYSLLAAWAADKDAARRRAAAVPLAVVFESTKDRRVRALIVSLLVGITLTDKKPLVRYVYRRALDRCWHPQAIKQLYANAINGRVRDRERVRALDGLARLTGGVNRSRALKKSPKRAQLEKAIVALIRDKDDEVAFAAIRAAGALVIRTAESALLARLSERDILHSAPAAWALGQIGSKRAIGPLLQSLKKGKKWALRAAAADALARLKNKTIVDAIKAAAPDDKLLWIDPVLTAAAGLKDPALFALVERYTRNSNHQVRTRAAWTLSRIRSPRSVKVLAGLLKDADASVAAAAAMALTELALPASTGHLRTALAHKDPSVRAAAIEGLGRLGDQASLAKLIQAAESEKLPQVRAVAISALGTLGVKLRDAAGLKVLIKGFDHAEVVVRAAAIRACARVRHEKTLGSWIAAAQKESNPYVVSLHQESLRQATEVKGPATLGQWKAWWQSAGASFKFKPSSDRRTRGSVVSFYQYLSKLSDEGVDLVFVFDVTGSMGGWLKQARENILSIASTVEAIAPSLRMGYIAFRDDIARTFDLSFDRKALHEAISKEQAAGGGDTPESIELAMDHAYAALSWRPRARKIIVVVGDAPSHDPDRCAVDAFLGKTRGITVHSMAADPLIKEFRTMAERSGGMLVDLSKPAHLRREVLVHSIGSAWRDEILKLLDQLEKK